MFFRLLALGLICILPGAITIDQSVMQQMLAGEIYRRFTRYTHGRDYPHVGFLDIADIGSALSPISA